MSDNKRWCMDFSNYEIRKYLIKKLKKGTDVLYIVNDEYVSADCEKDYEYITFDGIKQEFYISFIKSQTSIFINNYEIMLIDDIEKKFYTSSDVDDCIVYEGKLNDKSHKQILELILDFINLFQGALNIEVLEQEIMDYDYKNYRKKNFIVNINNPHVNSGRYVFNNIIINVQN